MRETRIYCVKTTLRGYYTNGILYLRLRQYDLDSAPPRLFDSVRRGGSVRDDDVEILELHRAAQGGDAPF